MLGARQGMSNQKSNKIITIVFTGLLLIVTVFVFELTATLLLNNVSILSGGLLTTFRYYYGRKDRKIIQYIEDCAIYDNALAYTLKTGKCHIKCREFEVDYLINSVGMRDDEASLISPEIVVVGDSHAMGWGVGQDLIFSTLLENTFGKPVLNAAISSYGTVRELRILERINLDDLKYLIIQYCSNDYRENSVYAKNGNKLPIMNKVKYNLIKENHKRDVTYYFGKHSLNIALKIVAVLYNKMAASLRASNPINKTREMTTDEVNVFLNAIVNSHINLTNVTIIVFEVNASARNDSLFINRLNESMLEQATHSSVKNIQTIDLSSLLGKDKYFHLDDHINSSGHHAIAEAVVQLINETSPNNEVNRNAKMPNKAN